MHMSSSTYWGTAWHSQAKHSRAQQSTAERSRAQQSSAISASLMFISAIIPCDKLYMLLCKQIVNKDSPESAEFSPESAELSDCCSSHHSVNQRQASHVLLQPGNSLLFEQTYLSPSLVEGAHTPEISVRSKMNGGNSMCLRSACDTYKRYTQSCLQIASGRYRTAP